MLILNSYLSQFSMIEMDSLKFGVFNFSEMNDFFLTSNTKRINLHLFFLIE